MNCDQNLAKVIPKSPWKNQGSSEELSHYESERKVGRGHGVILTRH